MITAGSGYFGQGGGISLSTGRGYSGNYGGILTLNGGSSVGPPGATILTGGTGSNGFGHGGSLRFSSSSTSAGGNVEVIGGAANTCCGGNINGGDVLIDGGANLGSGIAGNIILGGTRGNVGIGTSSPGYTLDVNGDTNIASANVLRFGGTSVCTSAGCTSSSDERLKKNIKPLDNSLESILQLRGVRYRYKDEAKFGDGQQVGVIAQEVEKIYPEVVKTDSKTGFKAVAYDHLIAPLIEAFKTLYTRIQSIENQEASQIRDLTSLKSTKADKLELDNLKAESSAKIQKLESENAAFKQENAEIKARLMRLEKMIPSR